ncbi:21931_t:CDS:2 [Gigaspora margarita]|uniref:21931_t:CDS:1 n=1 Tax=Gigaspora margarita TaxID=4874 RepID=A0ABM8VZ51_GIGMA|nr:21931_t:CDS:2 [Gigaspora margarita]
MNFYNSISHNNILEVWRIVRIVGSANVYYIILFKDSSYLCTCTWPVSHGIVCQHYFAVLLELRVAVFYISLIMQQWYKDIYLDELDDVISNIPINCAINLFSKKKELKKEISKASEDYNNQENAIQVTNLIAITPRGRPSKRQKSAMELNDKQPLSTINENLNQSNYEQLNLEENPKQSYTCSNCHIKGHNICSCNLLRQDK